MVTTLSLAELVSFGFCLLRVKMARGGRCSRLRIGSKRSACPSRSICGRGQEEFRSANLGALSCTPLTALSPPLRAADASTTLLIVPVFDHYGDTCLKAAILFMSAKVLWHWLFVSLTLKCLR
jgi:hypothetical protein